MADVATLISNIELLDAGLPLPGDERPHPTFGSVGRIRANTAHLRVVATALKTEHPPVPSRLACELVDNLPTILAALRYWNERHSHGR